MTEVSIIGVDLAKRVFQLHGACADGAVAFCKKVNRVQFLNFLAQQPRCVVAMVACATAHSWGRQIAELGHEVKLIAPIYVKSFVKRQKNDVADAEAASRPAMRFVAVKSEALPDTANTGRSAYACDQCFARTFGRVWRSRAKG